MPVGLRLRSQPAYKYNPSPEPNAIRLLRLDDEPDTSESDIHGTLIHTTIDSAPPYFALSYCWGRLKQNDALLCDGKLLRITPSLAEALRRLRSLPSDQTHHPGWDLENRFFWIDQICINQVDTEERQSQVQMMGQIYSHAIRTLIWLGPDPNEIAAEAFSLAKRVSEMLHEEAGNIGETTQSHRLGWSSFNKRVATMLPRLRLEHGSTDVNNPPWSNLFSICSRSWMSRLWVIQEVVLSAKEPIVLCGRSMCGWDQFACAASFMVSNPRDKVFGLLGLSWEGNRVRGIPQALRPDYRSETSKVYARVARFLIMENSQSLTPICCDLYAHPLPWTRNSWSRLSLKHVPTWTPNWNHTTVSRYWKTIQACKLQVKSQANETNYTTPGYYLNLVFDSAYHAAANIPVQEFPDGNDGRMKLRGIVVDTVAECLAVETAFAQQRPLHGRISHVRAYLCGAARYAMKRLHKRVNLIDRGFMAFYEILSIFRRPLTLRILEAATARRPSVEPFATLQVLTRILISGTVMPVHDAQFDPEDYYLRHMRTLCIYLITALADERRRTSRPQYFQEYDEVLRTFANGVHEDSWECHVGNTCHGKRFFITSTGDMGIGPPCMKKGDIVTVLFGSDIPFILRRKKRLRGMLSARNPEGSDLFAIIGPCYVDGIMKGEAVEAAREGRLQEQDFEIY